MIEISLVMFSLLVEILLVLIVILGPILFIYFKHKQKDKKAVKQLVGQVNKQSKLRLQATGSFLSDKYLLEGDDLNKAINSIDQTEKKFIQKIINLYIKRDATALASVDAYLAEVIDGYKNLSPAVPKQETETVQVQDPAMEEELNKLRHEKAQLTEELSITKETMSNMISEFGSMFGGGQGHDLGKLEVVEKVSKNLHETDQEVNPPVNEDDKEATNTDKSIESQPIDS